MTKAMYKKLHMYKMMELMIRFQLLYKFHVKKKTLHMNSTTMQEVKFLILFEMSRARLDIPHWLHEIV